jgi:dihydroflavonol-4-reductase
MTAKTVCVTGASGFIGSYIVKNLLENGYKVKGTVRNVQNMEKNRYLSELPNAQDNLTFHEADLLVEGSFDAAVKDCDYVLHVASPYEIDVVDAQRDLVDPAVQGTRNVLEACKKSAMLKKVVITSSVSAITDEPINGKVYTEDDWNDKSSLTRNAYFYSKVVAEKLAWKFLEEEEKLHFDIAVVNPYFVIGKELNKPQVLNESHQMLGRIFSFEFPGILDLAWGFVDVRDVAEIHRLVMENPEAKGRFIACHSTHKMREVVQMFQEFYPKRWLPFLPFDNWFGSQIVKMIVWLTKGKGASDYTKTHLGRMAMMDNSKSKNVLNFEYRDIWETLRWTTDWLIEEEYI